MPDKGMECAHEDMPGTWVLTSSMHHPNTLALKALSSPTFCRNSMLAMPMPNMGKHAEKVLKTFFGTLNVVGPYLSSLYSLEDI